MIDYIIFVGVCGALIGATLLLTNIIVKYTKLDKLIEKFLSL